MFWSSIKPPSINPFWRHDRNDFQLSSIRWLLVIYLSALRESIPSPFWLPSPETRTNQDKLFIAKVLLLQIERGGYLALAWVFGDTINVSSVAFSVSLCIWFMRLFFGCCLCFSLFWVFLEVVGKIIYFCKTRKSRNTYRRVIKRLC